MVNPSKNIEGDLFKILAVDDDPGILHLINKKLKGPGRFIASTDSPGNIEKLLIENKPDLLLLDYFMGSVIGKDLIPHLREKNILPPFIIMTGHGDERIAVNMMKLGASDYVVKDSNFLDFLPEIVSRHEKQILTSNKLKVSEAELKESINKYQMLYESSADPVCFFEENGVINEYNPAFSMLFNYEEADLKDFNIRRIFKTEEDFNNIIKYLQSNDMGEGPLLELINKNNEIMYCLLKVYKQHISQGSTIGYQVVIHDLTDRVLYEEKIKQLNDELETRVADRTYQLEDALEELRYENEERKKTQDALFNAKEELTKMLDREKELNEMKSRFVAMVSHEYRTPLTVILSSTYLLEQYFEMGDKGKFKKQTEKIQQSVQNMTLMLEDIMSIGKSDSQEQEFVPGKIMLNDFIYKLFEEVKLLDNQNHKFELNSKSNSISIYSEPKLLSQAISNLLSNAVKYSPPESEISISIAENPSEIIIDISDEGMGISDVDSKSIFEPFYRSRDVQTISGTGLGLTIVKKCIDALKGSITVTSREKIGTTFSVVLPKK